MFIYGKTSIPVKYVPSALLAAKELQIKPAISFFLKVFNKFNPRQKVNLNSIELLLFLFFIFLPTESILCQNPE